MSLHHSEQTHRNLLARLPDATGRALTDWFHEVDAGPALLRFEERVNWLRAEYNLSHGFATAIIHEHDVRRAGRAFA
ncbi:MAG TPA: DUF4287 domain-containing protein [Actinocrinis sp.]|jgi:hypothetical protein|uniref:DUF4287 domain-containing protein n=1 Tax=Actinocrinis sp. TaxID=1920516 RepID=UPI002DDD0CC4|nr:DUF4287 domain-containing protein [Actinocrinis sp.]HEV3174051.1 DUF4287 domain-containing protein [Actinocrinis sp.]